MKKEKVQTRMSFIFDAIEEVMKITGKKKPNGNMYGEIQCPKCGNILKYTRYSYNGHIHGRCETLNCLCWMM